jgi:hypothetical protein
MAMPPIPPLLDFADGTFELLEIPTFEPFDPTFELLEIPTFEPFDPTFELLEIPTFEPFDPTFELLEIPTFELFELPTFVALVELLEESPFPPPFCCLPKEMDEHRC